jgi:hypothetical protein
MRDWVYLFLNLFVAAVIFIAIREIWLYYFAEPYFAQSYLLDPVYSYQDDMVDSHIYHVTETINQGILMTGVVLVVISLMWFFLGILRGAETPADVWGYGRIWVGLLLAGVFVTCFVFAMTVMQDDRVAASAYILIAIALITHFVIPFYLSTLAFSPVVSAPEVPGKKLVRKSAARS